MSIKGVIFDFGGVIMRTEDRNPRLALAAKYNVPIEVIEELVFRGSSAKMAELGNISAYQHWKVVAQVLGAHEEEIPTIRQQFFSGDRLNWDLIKYIQKLRQNYRTALLSNAFDDLRAELTGVSPAPSAYSLSALDHFLDYFDEVIISAEIGLSKPGHQIYQYAAERLKLDIGECVFIDDYLPNVKGALQAGMQAIQFVDTSQVCQDLKAILDNKYSY
ncbi:MAG: HAD family phosphatase [Anaerolineaceae bacterium]|jgi:putative hydrolase of the HAD superfamily